MTPTVLGTKKRCCGWQARVGHSVGEEMPCRVLTWVRSLALGWGKGVSEWAGGFLAARET